MNNRCRPCRGKGEIDGQECAECEGTGIDPEIRSMKCANPGCYNSVYYHYKDSRVPDLCSSCYRSAKQARGESHWQQKPCATRGCTNQVFYQEEWEHKPNFCKQCREGWKSK